MGEGDAFQPVKSWVDEDRSVVGGLLPSGAVSVDVVDDRGTRVAAAVADGVYVAMLGHPADGRPPVVCCPDGAGTVIRRPLPAVYRSVLVDDADVPCPACGAIDYEEWAATETWRGGRPGLNGTTIPNAIVVCRRCGQQEAEPTFYGAVSSPEPGEER